MFRSLIAATLAATVLVGVGVTAAHAQKQTITGSGSTTGVGTGFGNVIGAGATLNLSQVSPFSNTVNISLTRGPGALNDIGVIYFSTQNTLLSGFTSTTTLTDSSDGGRSAVSGFDGTNRAVLNFANGFTADYALAFGDFGAALFGLNAGANHTFIDFQAPTTQGQFNYALNIANLGIVRGQYFDFVTTYLSTTAYRSDEFIGITSFTPPGAADGSTNIGRAPATLGANSYVRFVTVPEPSALPLALSALSLVGAVAVRRRKTN